MQLTKAFFIKEKIREGMQILNMIKSKSGGGKSLIGKDIKVKVFNSLPWLKAFPNIGRK